MSLTFSDLISADTQAQALAALLAILEMEGFPTTSWQEGSVPRTLTEGEAAAYADLCTLVASIARGGYVATAEGDWLTYLVGDFYALARQGAVATRGLFRLTDAGGGPHTIAANDLIVTSEAGLRYRNLTGGTLAEDGTLDLSFEAEATGAAYNLPDGATLTLTTSLPTVTVATAGGVGSWITTQGSNGESDDSLRLRARARWPGTTYMLSTATTYDAAARTASAEVTKVKVFPNDPEAGQVKIVLAGSSGDVSGTAITDVETYIEDRLPLCVTATVVSAAEKTITVTAQLQCEAAYVGTVAAQAETALAALQAALPIGGQGEGYVFRASILEALMGPTGMINVVLSAPLADVTLTSTQVAVFSVALTAVAIG